VLQVLSDQKVMQEIDGCHRMRLGRQGVEKTGATKVFKVPTGAT